MNSGVTASARRNLGNATGGGGGGAVGNAGSPTVNPYAASAHPPRFTDANAANTQSIASAAVAAVQQEQRKIFQQQRRRFYLRVLFLFVLSISILYITAVSMGLLPTLAALVLLRKMGWLQLIDVIGQYVVASTEGGISREALRRADTMAQPITKKMSESMENGSLVVGCSAMQGWRRSMEDDHTLILEDDGGFFGVYDGHSGPNVAKFCGANMHRFVTKTGSYAIKNYAKALYDGFIELDKHMFANYSQDRSGCTAVVLMVKGDELICANAGDSRCIICRDGEAFPLSNDHKPTLTSELLRIERAGGFVWNRRVNGVLALSRAIGDFSFKGNAQIPWEQQAVTSAPEVKTVKIDRERDEFAVIACDGIWDVMSSETVVAFVRPLLQSKMHPTQICELLMTSCISPNPLGLGCDNMSVIILQFKKQPTSFPEPQGSRGSFEMEAPHAAPVTSASGAARKTSPLEEATQPRSPQSTFNADEDAHTAELSATEINTGTNGAGGIGSAGGMAGAGGRMTAPRSSLGKIQGAHRAQNLNEDAGAQAKKSKEDERGEDAGGSSSGIPAGSSEETAARARKMSGIRRDEEPLTVLSQGAVGGVNSTGVISPRSRAPPNNRSGEQALPSQNHSNSVATAQGTAGGGGGGGKRITYTPVFSTETGLVFSSHVGSGHASNAVGNAKGNPGAQSHKQPAGTAMSGLDGSGSSGALISPHSRDSESGATDTFSTRGHAAVDIRGTLPNVVNLRKRSEGNGRSGNLEGSGHVIESFEPSGDRPGEGRVSPSNAHKGRRDGDFAKKDGSKSKDE